MRVRSISQEKMDSSEKTSDQNGINDGAFNSLHPLLSPEDGIPKGGVYQKQESNINKEEGESNFFCSSGS